MSTKCMLFWSVSFINYYYLTTSIAPGLMHKANQATNQIKHLENKPAKRETA